MQRTHLPGSDYPRSVGRRGPFLRPVAPGLPLYEPVRGLEITSKTGPPIARVSKPGLIRASIRDATRARSMA
jgi:hypothetical protein